MRTNFMRNMSYSVHRIADDPLLATLRNRLGLSGFRAGQRKIIEAVTKGRDALVVMPTGGGKSLCYQLPSLVQRGTTLVVSPLLALMTDQVDALIAKNIRATFINSSLTARESRERVAGLPFADWELIYVAPERFASAEFMRTLAQLDIRLLAIDEAHCISQWGHDFRPAYRRLREVRYALKNPPTLALTATASAKVQHDIIANLGLTKAESFVHGFDRPNLFLGVVHCNSKHRKLERLSKLISDGPALIYCSTREAVDEVFSALRAKNKCVAKYHAGMSDAERANAQEANITDKTQILVATNAFGMGIDKANIRTIIHFNHPGTLEAYYQEIGRAGRDGLPAHAVLLVSKSDRNTHEVFIREQCPSLEAVREVWNELGAMRRETKQLELFFTLAQLLARLKSRGVFQVSSAGGAGRCLVALEQHGFLNRINRRDRTMSLRLRVKEFPPNLRGRQKAVLEAIHDNLSSERWDDLLILKPERLCVDLGIERTQLLLALNGLHSKGVLDYCRPGACGGVRLLPNKISSAVEHDMSGRRNTLIESLNTMVTYFEAACHRKYILEYFGDVPLFAKCGNCTGCASSRQF